jgi:hypothetical protein
MLVVESLSPASNTWWSSLLLFCWAALCLAVRDMIGVIETNENKK